MSLAADVPRDIQALALALVGLLAGCDPAYYIHVEADVTDGEGRGVEGARIIALAEPVQSFETDSRGHATGRFGGFLESHPHEPIAVYKEGYRLFVGFPGRDYVLEGRGWFFVTEWDSHLAVTLQKLPAIPGTAPVCDSHGSCTVVLPAPHRGWCVPVLLGLPGTAVTVSRPEGETEAVGSGASRLSFEVDPATETTTQFLIQTCHSSTEEAGEGAVQSSWAMTTDPLTWVHDQSAMASP